MPTKGCLQDFNHEALGFEVLSGRQLTIIDPKRLTNAIIFLLIGDTLGPLGNVCHVVSVQTLYLKTVIYRSARGYVRIWDLLSRALCPPRMSTQLESCAKCSEYISGT